MLSHSLSNAFIPGDQTEGPRLKTGQGAGGAGGGRPMAIDYNDYHQ